MVRSSMITFLADDEAWNRCTFPFMMMAKPTCAKSSPFISVSMAIMSPL